MDDFGITSCLHDVVAFVFGEFQRAVDQGEVTVGLGEITEVAAGFEIEVLAEEAVAVG